MHVYQGTPYDQYFQGVEHIMDDYGGRPHWGKLHFQTAATLAPRYPRWDEFQALRARLDPDGRFTSPYLDRILGPVLLKLGTPVGPTAQMPSCAVGSDEGPGVAAAGVVDGEAAARRTQGAGPGRARRRARTGRAGRRAAGSGRRRPGGRRRRAGASGTGSPPNSQMTVRSLNSAWKLSPLSMPQTWPSLAEQAVAALAVGVVGQQVEGADRPELVVVVLVLEQGEVVLLEVGVDEPLQRALARAAPRRAARSAGTRSQPSASHSS